MKKTRLAKQALKRKKKAQFKQELKNLRERVFNNNQPISSEVLAEYRLAKDKLIKLWYPNKTK